MPAQTVVNPPAVIVGIPFTVMLIGCEELVPQPFVAVSRPLYVPGAVLIDTGIGIGLAGIVTVVILVSPAGEPIQLMLYVDAGPVAV